MNKLISRRTFVEGSGFALATALFAPRARAADSRLFAYVGFSTEEWNGGSTGGGIKAFRVNMADGSLHPVSTTGSEAADLNSDGICTSTDGRFLYCVNRTTALGGIPGVGGGVYAFAINREDGSLRHLNTVPSMGAMSCAVMIDRANARLVVGNHGAINRVTLIKKKNGVPVIERPTDEATVALFPLRTDGSIGQPLDVAQFREGPVPGSESVRSEVSESAPTEAMGKPIPTVQVGPACHGVAFDRTQRWIIATDNGYDHIYVYRHRPASRRLEGKAFPVAAGTGPRHVATHPRAPFFFVTNEWAPTISAFHLDERSGDVRHVQTIGISSDSGTPPTEGGGPSYTGPSPADIRVHPNGRFVYASTRRIFGGNDTISVFAVDQATGRLTLVDVVETGGRMQREFNIEPSGRFLFACNLFSNDVTTFALDEETGKAKRVARTEVPRASVISFASL